VKGKQLKATAEFYDGPGPHGEFAQEVFDLYAMGFMRATSVGFRALAPVELRRGDPDPDTNFQPVLGLLFDGQELMEFSAVPVPANPNALATFAAKGLMDDLFPVSWKTLGPVLGYTPRDADPEPTPDAAEKAREIRADQLKRVGQALDMARITQHLSRLTRS